MVLTHRARASTDNKFVCATCGKGLMISLRRNGQPNVYVHAETGKVYGTLNKGLRDHAAERIAAKDDLLVNLSSEECLLIRQLTAKVNAGPDLSLAKQLFRKVS